MTRFYETLHARMKLPIPTLSWQSNHKWTYWSHQIHKNIWYYYATIWNISSMLFKNHSREPRLLKLHTLYTLTHNSCIKYFCYMKWLPYNPLIMKEKLKLTKRICQPCDLHQVSPDKIWVAGTVPGFPTRRRRLNVRLRRHIPGASQRNLVFNRRQPVLAAY